MKKTSVLIVLAAIAIPIVLNFILPIETGLRVLGGKGDVSTWLTFWGSYLAAIGSFFLGWFSYKINQNSVRQSDEILRNNAWERIANRYYRMEKFIINEEQIHHSGHISELIAYLKKKDYNTFLLCFSNWQKELNSSSLRIIRYVNVNTDYSISNMEVKEYGMSLSKINLEALEIIEVCLEHKSDEESIKGLINKLEQALEKYNPSFKYLMSTGFNLLTCEKRRLGEETKKNNISLGFI